MSLKQELEEHWNATGVITQESVEYRKTQYKLSNLPQDVIDHRLERITPNVTKQLFFALREDNTLNVVDLMSNSLQQVLQKVQELGWVADKKVTPDSKLIFVKKLPH